MKGRKPNKAEQEYMNEARSRIGCVVCWLKHNEFNDECMPHHIDGKTKPDAHLLTIPLCPEHHQYGENARHINKARFEAEYGTEIYLKIRVDERLRAEGVHVPELTNFRNKFVLQYLQEFEQGRQVEDCY